MVLNIEEEEEVDVVGIGAAGVSNLLDLEEVLVVVAPSLPNMVLPFFLRRNRVGV